MRFELFQSNDYLLTTHSGLAIIGAMLQKTKLKSRLIQTPIPKAGNPDISHGDVAAAYLGLLCQGKNDFDHIEPFRKDDFYRKALSIAKVPSSPTLRQRMDLGGDIWSKIVEEENINLLKNVQVTLTPTRKKWLPLDIDVSPFDNSNTKKEGVSCTYKKFDGYAPIFAYLGQEGYCIKVELREGKVHCQLHTEIFLAQAIQNAKKLTCQPLLVRMDSGNDSQDNIKVMYTPQTKADFIIKHNLRRESPEFWRDYAKEHGVKNTIRDGLVTYTGSINCAGYDGLRQVYQITETTIDCQNQILLIPELKIDIYWTSLAEPADEVILLYHEHATSEQFHSEIKTDLDLERLPSGKFATNGLILHLGIMAFNMLRLIGQASTREDDVPLRKKVERRRIRTVIQNLITIASRVITHGRRYRLNFGRHSPWFPSFRRIYYLFS
jgi:hypothetical protein